MHWDDFRDAYSLVPTVSLASHLLNIFSAVVWASLLAGEELLRGI